MRLRTAPVLLAAACSSSGPGAWTQTVQLPLDVQEVIDAVSALPECPQIATMDGVIHWVPVEFMCRDTYAAGCSYPDEQPPRIVLVANRSAWDTSLAHELCHLCGYMGGPDLGETEAEACAYRARLSRPPIGGM